VAIATEVLWLHTTWDHQLRYKEMAGPTMIVYGIISTVKCWQKTMSCYQPPCHNCFHLTITF